MNNSFLDKTAAQWEFEMTKIFFKLKNECESFTADNVYSECRAVAMPPQIIKRLIGSFFKRFQASGYITQTKEFKLSERNGSSPLPVWRKASEEKPSELSKLR